MSRRKKTKEINEGLEFDNLFGAFQAESVDSDNEPMCKIVTIGEEYAQPCRYCGDYPEIHIANFKDKEKYPFNVYICCSHCLECDGVWYPDAESALAEWNNCHIGSRPRDKSKKDAYDYIRDFMKDFKIVD